MHADRQLIGEGGELLTMPVADAVKLSSTGDTILIGELRGAGRLHVGDLALCDGRELEIAKIEKFQEVLTDVAPGEGAIGLAVGRVEQPEALRGRVLRFARRPASGLPALVDGAIVVPDQGLLVAFSERRRSPVRRFALLILDGLQVRLIDRDGATLVDAPGETLAAGIASGTQVALRAPDETIRYLVGPQPQWAKQSQAAELIERYGATFLPDPRLFEGEGRMAKLMVTRGMAQLRYTKQWPPALLKMLRTRGVRSLDGGGISQR